MYDTHTEYISCSIRPGVTLVGKQQKVDFSSLIRSLQGTEEASVKSILKKQDGSKKVEKPAEAIHIREVR